MSVTNSIETLSKDFNDYNINHSVQILKNEGMYEKIRPELRNISKN